MIDWLTDWLVGWLIDWLSAVWLTDLLTNKQTNNQASNQPTNQPTHKINNSMKQSPWEDYSSLLIQDITHTFDISLLNEDWDSYITTSEYWSVLGYNIVFLGGWFPMSQNTPNDTASYPRRPKSFFITVLTRAHHLFVSLARWIQPTPYHIISFSSTLILILTLI